MTTIESWDEHSQKEVFDHMSSEYNESLERQFDTIMNLQNKALEVIKVNFLVIGALVAGSSYFLVQEDPGVILLLGTTLSFVVSTLMSVKTYSSYMPYKHGFGYGDIDDYMMCETKREYYELEARSYNYWLGTNVARYRQHLQDFHIGVWSAFVGVLCFSFLLVRSLVVSYPPFLDVLFILVFAGIGAIGYKITTDERSIDGEPSPPSLEQIRE